MAKEKEKIVPVVVHDRDSFNRALDREESVIIIEQPLYEEVKTVFTVSKGGKTVKTGSLVGGVVGFALGGFVGAGLMLASVVGGTIGALLDKSKMYAVNNIDVIRKRITLTKARGKNIFIPSKHEITMR